MMMRHGLVADREETLFRGRRPESLIMCGTRKFVLVTLGFWLGARALALPQAAGPATLGRPTISGYLRVERRGVKVPIPARNLRAKAYSKALLIAEDRKHYFIVGGNGTISAFPKKGRQGVSSGWVGEQHVFFAEAVDSVAAELPLHRGTQMPILSETVDSYVALYSGLGGRTGRLDVPVSVMGIARHTIESQPEEQPAEPTDSQTEAARAAQEAERERLAAERRASARRRQEMAAAEKRRRAELLAQKKKAEEALRTAREALSLAEARQKEKERLEEQLGDKERLLRDLEAELLCLEAAAAERAAAEATATAAAEQTETAQEVTEEGLATDRATVFDPELERQLREPGARGSAMTMGVMFAVITVLLLAVVLLALKLRAARATTGGGGKTKKEAGRGPWMPLNAAQQAALSKRLDAGELFGEVEKIGMLNIVQFLNTQKQSGRLVLSKGEEPRGHLAFEQGNIVFADFALETGERAVHTLLGRTDGLYVFYNEAPAMQPEQHNVTTKTSLLLMSICQKMDAAAEKATKLGQAQQPPAAAQEPPAAAQEPPKRKVLSLGKKPAGPEPAPASAGPATAAPTPPPLGAAGTGAPPPAMPVPAPADSGPPPMAPAPAPMAPAPAPAAPPTLPSNDGTGPTPAPAPPPLAPPPTAPPPAAPPSEDEGPPPLTP